MGARASRKARGSREAQLIGLRYEPSAREIFADEPPLPNVGPERPRTPKPERKGRTQTARQRARRRPVREVSEVAPERVSRKALKRIGVKLVPAPKVPTPQGERLHSWTVRVNPRNRKTEIRPSRIGVHRYGIRDLGWKVPSKYWTKAGKLRKGLQA